MIPHLRLLIVTKEAKECKVNLQETPWRVDLMLYFFYTGGK